MINKFLFFNKFLGIFLLFTLLLISTSLLAATIKQPIFTISADTEDLALDNKISLLEDASGQLSIADVSSMQISKQFIPPTKNHLSLGFTNSTYWVKLIVYNSTAKTLRGFLESQYPLIDYLTLYSPDADGGWNAQEYGDHYYFFPP